MKKWEKSVERALRTGLSPFEPFLEEGHPDVKLLATILVRMDWQAIYERVKETRERAEPPVEQRWKRMKEEAQPLVKPLMVALDNLEKRFLARKQLCPVTKFDEEISGVRWLLADELIKTLNEPSPADADVVAVKKLIAARYLVAENSNQPWDYLWDE